MSDKRQKDPSSTPDLSETQRLLQGVELDGEVGYRLEDILAEYRGGASAEAPREPVRSQPLEEESRRVIQFPGVTTHVPTEAEQEETAPVLQADNELDDISPEALFGLPLREKPVLLPEEPEEEEEEGEEMEAEEELPPEPPVEEQPQAESEAAVSMEEIVASTVDAVKKDQQRRRDKLHKKMERERKKHAPRAPKRKEPTLRQPLPEVEDEPLPGEVAMGHKRQYQQCRRSLLLSLPVLLLLWLPWLLTQLGVTVPFFSAGVGNASVCVLMPQVLLCVLCWPVFRKGLEELRQGNVTTYFLAALANGVTLLDEITLLFLPERAAVPPLGGVAAVIGVFALWGLTGYHRGMWETCHTAAMGQPAFLVDCGTAGVSKGFGRRDGFCIRTGMEDTASQWQRLMLPVLVVATLVFGVLASVGQGRGQDLLWCWSAVLCAASSLVFPLAYAVPFGRLAARLSRSGAAVAGQYGAAVLASCRQIVVTDSDLFPHGTVALNGLKLYGEERNHALSYAATLAVQAGGALGRVFEEICRGERIAYQPLEHFHIHDDNGLGGMIHGETVLVGTPMFMRHMAVRLPSTMPYKSCVCLAVDGQLTAIFAVKYNTSPTVEGALHALGRNGLQLTLAVRDGNITPKLLKTRFGTDGNAHIPEISERLALSEPDREMEGPNGLLYRDGLFPFVELVAGSRRLCHVVRVGNLLSLLGAVFGALLGFYLTFAGSYNVLTPMLLLTYLLLWVVPMVPLLWGVDRT